MQATSAEIWFPMYVIIIDLVNHKFQIKALKISVYVGYANKYIFLLVHELSGSTFWM